MHAPISQLSLLHVRVLPLSACRVTVTFVDKEGKDVTVQAKIGKNLLEVAHENEIDLEGDDDGGGWGVRNSSAGGRHGQSFSTPKPHSASAVHTCRGL